MPNLEFRFSKLKGFIAKRIYLVGDANIFGASEHLTRGLTGREHISFPRSIPGRHQAAFLYNSFYIIYNQYKFI